MTRDIEPELLDHLPVDDAGAVGSRRDLRRLNRLMGHTRILVRRTRPVWTEDRRWRLAEIGAGDGTFLLSVLKRLKLPPGGARVTFVDRLHLVSKETLEECRRLGCEGVVECADVFAWLETPRIERMDVIYANLFLHHFPEPELRRLLEGVARNTDQFIACEPARTRFALRSSKLLGWIGCNAVTRHDAVASVRSGFCGNELSALWPGDSGWTLSEGRAGVFSHAFVAFRKADEIHGMKRL
ncbi:MAG TPA: class I SAM-dependent methyltransferase [Methylomirabilota bacterium]|nr:class I SAM-dependent methyltransferase [Methylomirabilota bacterium]